MCLHDFDITILKNTEVCTFNEATKFKDAFSPLQLLRHLQFTLHALISETSVSMTAGGFELDLDVAGGGPVRSELVICNQ